FKCTSNQPEVNPPAGFNSIARGIMTLLKLRAPMLDRSLNSSYKVHNESGVWKRNHVRDIRCATCNSSVCTLLCTDTPVRVHVSASGREGTCNGLQCVGPFV
ncbi:hypothetical protein J6590_033315, partial [Homalodisca vitripennis]